MLIIIRGNSGSGKTTIAKALQKRIGKDAMLVSHDVVRRDILGIEDTPDNASIELMKRSAIYGREIGYSVIIEGVLPIHKYRDMIEDLYKSFEGNVLSYYLDVSFEETLHRHTGRQCADEFGEEKMHEWWREKDYLNSKHETVIAGDMAADEIVESILKDIQRS